MSFGVSPFLASRPPTGDLFGLPVYEDEYIRAARVIVLDSGASVIVAPPGWTPPPDCKAICNG